ncbi:kinase-like domain-containing protein, partial [Microdochium bolleyi]
ICIVMEYLALGDLQKHIDTTPLPESCARLIASQVLEGLDFMHSNNFVHRDLKPSNIMVKSPGPDWWVKIADFGLSKRRHEDFTTLHTMNRGTMGYAAPEILGLQAGAASYTFAVDMWSLGAVVYKLVTCQAAF